MAQEKRQKEKIAVVKSPAQKMYVRLHRSAEKKRAFIKSGVSAATVNIAHKMARNKHTATAAKLNRSGELALENCRW